MALYNNLLVLSICLFGLSACRKEVSLAEDSNTQSGPNLPSVNFSYSNIDLPNHFYSNEFIGSFQTSLNLINNTPEENPITDAGATLGRVLFYDVNLSKNRTISCASCHQQSHGFSDPNQLSIGFEGGSTSRHSMGLANAGYYGRGNFFWDERASSLEEQVLMPIQDPIEMGLSLDSLEERVNSLPYYASLFEASFGSSVANSNTVSMALAQFVRSLVSYRSKYDLARAEVDNPYVDFPSFTTQENIGKNIFLGPQIEGGRGCIDCHSTEGFVNIAVGPLSNGLDRPNEAEDLGHYAVTGNNNHLHTFKSPSLKNIAARPPYMHDGRFSSLAEVVEHYNSGVQNHPNINFSLLDSNGDPVRMNMTTEEKEALISFLETLDDEAMMTDEKFSNPF